MVRAEIIRLLELALSTSDEVLKREAVSHAFELSKGFRVRIPRKYSLLICRKCLTPYRFEGVSRVRVRRGRGGKAVVVSCGVCGSVRRIPFRP